jgi:hypothetical protein
MINLKDYGISIDNFFTTVGFKGWEYMLFDVILQYSSKHNFYGLRTEFSPEDELDNHISSIIPVEYLMYIKFTKERNEAVLLHDFSKKPVSDTDKERKFKYAHMHVNSSGVEFQLSSDEIKKIKTKNAGRLEFLPGFRGYELDYFDQIPFDTYNHTVIFALPMTVDSYLYPLWYYKHFYIHIHDLEIDKDPPDHLALMTRITKYLLPEYGFPFNSKHIQNKLVIDHLDLLMNDPEGITAICRQLLGNDFELNTHNYVLSYVIKRLIDPYKKWLSEERETINNYHEIIELFDTLKYFRTARYDKS